MTQTHPEQWLELAVAGRLDADARSGLDGHLAGCSECALYVNTAGLFRGESTQQVHSDHLNRWAVERAMAQLGTRRHSARRWWMPVRWAWVPAAGLLLVTAAVSAKLWTATPSHTAEPVRGTAAATTAPRLGAPTVTVEAPTPAPLPVSVDLKRDQAIQAAPQPRRPSHTTAATLFDRARALGHAGRADEAVKVHLRLQHLFPDTPEAELSSALAGQLLLGRGQVQAALAQFDRHLAHGGAADEEALAGRAASLQRLGRQSQEIRAWQTLLKRHPRSVYADRANGRLRDLSAR